LGQYDKVIEILKKLRKHKDVKGVVYQLYGNALDLTGKPVEAIKMYEEGIQKFPNDGFLYLEIGNVLQAHDLNDEALRLFNLGIKKDPNFASNYYRGANLYFETDTAAWGLIYAETEILLKPGDSQRHYDMANAIVECYKNNIKQTGEYPEVIPVKKEESLVKVSLSPATELKLTKVDIDNSIDSEGYIGAPGVIEGCYTKALTRFLYEREKFDPLSFESVCKLRRYVVEAYFDVTDNYFGDGLYLLEFQKKIIDAGHWDAYNYFLFSDVLLYSCEIWNNDNKGAFDAFVDWYNDNNAFRLGDGKTVGKLSVMRYVKPKGLFELLKFTRDLALPYGAKPVDEDVETEENNKE
ncbi:MAG: hypothetical protein K2K84_08725, partial [Muribaculaceae bacterium]|nr:hypothetical protein [Muribaculaceae bacterium]